MNDPRRFDILKDTSSEIFRQIVAETADGIIGVDSESRIVLFNRSAEQMFGWSAEDILGKDIGLLMPERHRITHPAHIAEFARGEVVTRYMGKRNAHIVGIRANGSEIPLGATISRIDTPDGMLMIAIVRDISDRMSFQDELERIANVDPLTGILNRRAFLSRAEHELKRSARYKQEFSILLLDLDNFKSINDEYGHQAGDLALCNFARICQQELRSNDLFARWGGEEFIALLIDADIDDAIRTAERIRAHVERFSFRERDKGDISFTVSVGISTVAGGRNTIESGIREADDALYAAKRSGRNRVVSHELPVK